MWRFIFWMFMAPVAIAFSPFANGPNYDQMPRVPAALGCALIVLIPVSLAVWWSD